MLRFLHRLLDPARPSSSTVTPKPARRRRWLRWSLEAALFIGVWFVLQAWMRRNLLPADGRPAPAVALRHLDGRPARLADYQGEAVQLHFWATWCGVCRMEHSALNAVHDGLGAGQRLISVVADGDDLDHLRKHLAEHDVRYPVLIADEAALAAFGVSSFPTNFYLSPEGNLSAHDIGWSTRWGMRARLSGCW